MATTSIPTHCPTVFMPEELLFEILVRLPVKSLLRFKCVRKSWYVLIKSSDFIHCHRVIAESYSNPKLGAFVFDFDEKMEYDSSVGITVTAQCRQILRVSGENSFNMCENLGMIPYLANPYPTVEESTLAGSCHGVLCFYHLNDIRKGIVLWNPATRKSKLLPHPLKRRSKFSTCFVAFGFDAETSDYKVLCAKFFENKHQTCLEIQIYKRSTDSWSWVDSDFRSAKCLKLDGTKQGRYLNGTYFCIGIKKYIHTNDTIVSFDFNKEVFRPIPFPSEFVWPGGDVMQLDLIRDKLACIKESIFNGLRTFEVWLLNDSNAIQENYTWNMLHKVNTANEFGRCVPIAISENREFCFVSVFNDTKLYNFLTGEFEDWSIGRGRRARKTDVHKESLVSVDA